MLEKIIKVTAEDGYTFGAFQATPQVNVKGGLVILQEIFGANDIHSPPEIIAGVKENISDAESYVYEAGHAFANNATPDLYSEQATLGARSRTLEFLDRVHQEL